VYNYEVTLKNLTESNNITINLMNFFSDVDGLNVIIIQPTQEYKTKVICNNDTDCIEKFRLCISNLNLIWDKDFFINLQVI